MLVSVLLGDPARVVAAGGTLLTTAKSGIERYGFKDSGSVKKIHPDWQLYWTTTVQLLARRLWRDPQRILE